MESELVLISIWGCWVFGTGAIVTRSQSYCENWRCVDPVYRPLRQRHFRGAFSVIVHQFTYHSTNWAHWLCEACAVLVWLPPELARGATVVWFDYNWRHAPFIEDGLRLFGFGDSVGLTMKQYCFAEQVLTLVPFKYNRPYRDPIWKFREVVISRLKLENQSASQYFLMQRKRARLRVIKNLDEIAETFRTALPSLHWRIVAYFPSVEESAREFSRANLLFAVHGAGCGSMIFMPRNSIFIELGSAECMSYMWQLARICGIYHVIHTMESVHHFQTRKFVVDLGVIHQMIGLIKRHIGIPE
jgi:hypothetical protein